MTSGRLVLVGTPLGNASDLSPRAADMLRVADVVACEDTRHTRKLLAVAGIEPRAVVALHEHNEASAGAALVDRIVRERLTVALVTDAGMPAVSDPGERIVRLAIDAGIAVEVVPGPTAATTALAISGLPTERWVFEGFLPRKGRERAERLAGIAEERRTVVLYEAPHRLVATLEDLRASCGEARRVAIARELTKLFEEVWRGSLADAARHATDVAPRGEYTLVLGPADPPAAVDAADLVAEARALLASGVTRRDAADHLAATHGVSRRVAYAAVHDGAAGR